MRRYERSVQLLKNKQKQFAVSFIPPSIHNPKVNQSYQKVDLCHQLPQQVPTLLLDSLESFKENQQRLFGILPFISSALRPKPQLKSNEITFHPPPRWAARPSPGETVGGVEETGRRRDVLRAGVRLQTCAKSTYPCKICLHTHTHAHAHV